MAHEIVPELEEYVKTSEIEPLVSAMMQACFREKPEEPAAFMIDYLWTKLRGKGTRSEDGGVSVALWHPDSEKREYIKEQGLEAILEKVVMRAVDDQPPDVMEHMRETLDQMQKNE